MKPYCLLLQDQIIFWKLFVSFKHFAWIKTHSTTSKSAVKCYLYSRQSIAIVVTAHEGVLLINPGLLFVHISTKLLVSHGLLKFVLTGFCKCLQLVPLLLQSITSSLDLIRAAVSLVNKLLSTLKNTLVQINNSCISAFYQLHCNSIIDLYWRFTFLICLVLPQAIFGTKSNMRNTSKVSKFLPWQWRSSRCSTLKLVLNSFLLQT